MDKLPLEIKLLILEHAYLDPKSLNTAWLLTVNKEWYNLITTKVDFYRLISNFKTQYHSVDLSSVKIEDEKEIINVQMKNIRTKRQKITPDFQNGLYCLNIELDSMIKQVVFNLANTLNAKYGVIKINFHFGLTIAFKEEFISTRRSVISFKDAKNSFIIESERFVIKYEKPEYNTLLEWLNLTLKFNRILITNTINDH